MIRVSSVGPEMGKTVRAAIRSWGPTVRLVILMAAATACWIIVLQFLP